MCQQVVPTEYDFLSGENIATNQFSATEHFRQLTPTSEKGLPSTWTLYRNPVLFSLWRTHICRFHCTVVSFAYTFSPIMFRIEEYRKGLLQFLTSVCAIVGGVFTVQHHYALLTIVVR